MSTKKMYVSDNPELLAEWDNNKNSEIGFFPDAFTLGSVQKVWWKCEKGHSWQAPIRIRNMRNTGCPVCANRVALRGYNDLQTLYSQVHALIKDLLL